MCLCVRSYNVLVYVYNPGNGLLVPGGQLLVLLVPAAMDKRWNTGVFQSEQELDT